MKIGLITGIAAVLVAVCVWKLVHLVIASLVIGVVTGLFLAYKLR